MKKYNYYSRDRINEILLHFYDRIKNELKLPKQKTIYSRIENDAKINSSNNLLEEFKIINNITNNYSHDISKLKLNDFDDIDYVVFIDDIIGSGKTIIDFIELNKDKLKKTISIIFCIECMEHGKKNIDEYLDKEGIECIILPYQMTKRAFDNNDDFEDNDKARASLYDFEMKISKGYKRFILGFNRSEALVSFFRNTPNNTISAYWNPYEGWNPLFPRELDKPDFMKNRNKFGKNNSKSNIPYNLAKLINNKKEES